VALHCQTVHRLAEVGGHLHRRWEILEKPVTGQAKANLPPVQNPGKNEKIPCFEPAEFLGHLHKTWEKYGNIPFFGLAEVGGHLHDLYSV